MRSNLILIVFGISGMTALIYEITWIRPLSLIFGTTLYSVTTIVASFILGLGIGSWVAGKYSDRLKNTLSYFGITQIAIGVYGILLLWVFPHLPDFYTSIYHVTYPNYELFLPLQVLFSILLLIVPTTLMGSTLPLLLKIYSKDVRTIGNNVGKLDGSNSFGAMIGVICAGFFMIPILGIHHTIIVTASINFIIGFGILINEKKLRKIIIIPIIIIMILVFFILPVYNVEVLNSGVYFVKPTTSILEVSADNQREVLYYDESAYSSVVVQEMGSRIVDTNGTRSIEYGKIMKINGKIQCSDYDSAVKGLINFANLPVNLYSDNFGTKPTSALNVGLGCGTSAVELGNIVPTTTIEIDPSVVEASKQFYDEIPNEIIIDDARNWLLRNSVTFDVIITEPTDPFVNNSVLFTTEYFEILKKSLTNNGLVAQWIPVYILTNHDFYIMYNTFHHVFPYVYGYEMELGSDQQIILIGSMNPLDNYENDYFLFNQYTIKELDTEINTDNLPILEFNTSKHLYDVQLNSDIGKIDFKK